MNFTTTILNDWQNATAAEVIISPSNSALTAGAVAGVFMAILVITLLLCKYKPGYFFCFRPPTWDQRRPSNVGLTHVDEEETENITNVLESDIQVDDDYFYDEVFERSAFTDEATNLSITNLYTIPDKEDDDRPHTTHGPNHI